MGSPGCWTLVFKVGGDTLPPGAAIRISVPHGFTPPQIDDPEAPGYVSVRTSNPAVALVLSVETAWGEGVDAHTGQDRNFGVLLLVERAPLKPEETVTLIYGAGPGQVYASPFAGQASFRVSLCPDGRAYPERFFPIRTFPAFDVISEDPHCLEVIAPSQGEAGAPLDLRVMIRDRMGNRCSGWSGWFKVDADAEGVQAPVSQRQEDANGDGILLRVGLPEELKGPVRFRVQESETGLEGVSNPVFVGDTAPFWGDLHVCAPEGSGAHPALDFELSVGSVPTIEKTSFHFHADGLPDGAAAAVTGTGPLRFALPDAQRSDEMLPSHLLEIYSCWGNREYWGGAPAGRSSKPASRPNGARCSFAGDYCGVCRGQQQPVRCGRRCPPGRGRTGISRRAYGGLRPFPDPGGAFYRYEGAPVLRDHRGPYSSPVPGQRV